MIIRRMKPTDFEKVFELIVQVNNLHADNRSDLYDYIQPYKDQKRERYDSQYNDESIYLLVAEDGGKIVGFCSASIGKLSENPVQKLRKVVDIDNIVVDENCRSKGIGRRLYEAIVGEAKKINADSIELTVFSFNKNAISFYEGLGMTVKNIKYEQIL